MMEFVFTVFAIGVSSAIYVTPLVLLGYILRRDPSTRRVAFLVFFIAPLIGEATYLLSLKDQGVSWMATLNFWRTVLVWYPMAVLPLGFWAAFFGAVGTNTSQSIAIRYKLGVAALSVIGFFVGAIFGAVFMIISTILGMFIQGGGRIQPEDGLLPYALAGLFAGAVCGVISGYIGCTAKRLKRGQAVCQE